MTAKTALDRWIDFLRADPPDPVGARVDPSDPSYAPLLALAQAKSPRLHALMMVLIERATSFSVYDVQLYPEYFRRGKRGETWNEGERIVGPDDVCIAKNGGGDPYVWNATRGDVRLLIHDEGFRQSAGWADVESFVDNLMERVVEGADADQVDEADDAYLRRLCFAIEVAGDEELDSDAKEKLVERGLLEG
jgi:hypothetical protein